MNTNNSNITININCVKMKDCNMDMSVNNNVLEEVEATGEAIFIRNPDDRIRSIFAVTNSSGSRISIVAEVSSTRWIMTETGSTNNRVTVNLEGTNLYMTLPSGDNEFITLEPLRGFDNAQQFLDRRFLATDQIPFELSRGGVTVSTETSAVAVGSFLVVPTSGKPVQTAVLGTREV